MTDKLQWRRTSDGLPSEHCESGKWYVTDSYKGGIVNVTNDRRELRKWEYYCPYPVIAPPAKPDSKLVKWLMPLFSKPEHHRSTISGILLQTIFDKATNGDFD